MSNPRISVSAVGDFICRPAGYIQLHQVLCPILRCFPMLPNTHPQMVAYVTVQTLTQSLHAPDFEVVYPSSDELVQFLHFVAVAHTPASACQFLHLYFEFRYCFRVRSGFISFGKCVKVKSKSEILDPFGLVHLALFSIYFQSQLFLDKSDNAFHCLRALGTFTR